MFAYRPLSGLPTAPPPGTAGCIRLPLREVACRFGAKLLGAAGMELAETLETLFAQGISGLPEMSASASCWLVERLATAAGKTPAWML